MSVDVYWYISKAKLDLLKQSAPGFLTGVSVKLEFKLPFVSGSLAGTDHSALVKDLERVVEKLKVQGIKNYDELRDDEAPIMVHFEGPAVRQVDGGNFWVAMQHNTTALLLAGSAGFAIGNPPNLGGSVISPSADPVGAVKAAFEKVDRVGRVSGMSLSGSLSYVWQAIMRDSLQSGATLPRAEGVAIFASAVAADRAQMRRVQLQQIQRIVVGTPLYVKQA